MLWSGIAIALLGGGEPGAGSDARPSGDDLARRLARVEEELAERKGEGDRSGPSLRERIGLDITLGGQYRVMANASNFAFHSATIPRDASGRDFANQRFRTWLDVRTNRRTSAYLQVEMGHLTWGEDADFPKQYPFTDAKDDEIGVELRYGYLQYEHERIGRFRLGVQPWSDRFADTLFSADWDFDVAGIGYRRTFPSLGEADVVLGAFALGEGPTQGNEGDVYLLTSDIDVPLGDERSAGLSVYFIDDHGDYSYGLADGSYVGPGSAYRAAYDWWGGLRGETGVGDLHLFGCAILNVGYTQNPHWEHRGWAFLGKASYPVLGGEVKLLAAYSTGDRHAGQSGRGSSGEFRTVAQSLRDDFGAQGYWSLLGLTSPRGASDVNDLGVGLQNRGLGLTTVQVGYSWPSLVGLDLYTAAGWLRASEANALRERSMGLELLSELGYDLGGGLGIEVGFGYLFAGDFYRASAGAGHPDGLYETYARAQLEF